MKKFWGMLSIVVLLVLAACGGEEKVEKEEAKTGTETAELEELVVGVIPTLNQGNMQVAMDKLSKHFEAELDMPVKVTVYPDYQAVVQAMNYDDVNMAYFGPATYIDANEQSGARAIMTQLIDGEPFYYSYIITHKDSPLQSIDDLVAKSKELNFAFGDPSSTSGSLIPSIELKEQGVFTNQNEHQFEQVLYTGGHDATAIAVANNQVDAGAIDSAIFNTLKKNGKIGDDYKVIWESEKLFQYPWAVSKAVDDELVAKIQDAFLRVEDKEILDAFAASGFTKATDSDYESIREAKKQAAAN
ncbi:phosphate/phosphite/phosphonate ABC transporter substrate-binding protein [Bacillus suaedaesalsae]|uniref:Phosphate/phosphite/phosphonate ABC transporter substrate-binding protein n=1 Tax=Bacillus suaedaesalsae TaxID=2810349 RepID=A0ABS2DIP2_9BACI|nr:phosphate/phosphite/phosphonate ABC transporter substrate-binding protein [Bacillus suaedaesalsae]MBM6618318.1 phosphate/phosphite/phosphonate ABC transporter substrate-binding protein [Bacillus suaedaesalsae]